MSVNFGEKNGKRGKMICKKFFGKKNVQGRRDFPKIERDSRVEIDDDRRPAVGQRNIFVGNDERHAPVDETTTPLPR